jgi:hypothetical protein
MMKGQAKADPQRPKGASTVTQLNNFFKKKEEPLVEPVPAHKKLRLDKLSKTEKLVGLAQIA